MSAGLRSRLRNGETLTMLSLRHASPTLAQFAAGLGFDFIFIDLEHGRISIETADLAVRMIRAAGGRPIVRSTSASYDAIHLALDLDVAGLVIPNVESASEAARVISLCLSLRREADGPLIVPMIESRNAICELDAILKIEEIDALFLGPADLAGSLGLAGQTQHADVRAAANGVIERAGALQRPVGIPAYYSDLPALRSRPPGLLYFDLNALLKEGASAALGAARPKSPSVR